MMMAILLIQGCSDDEYTIDDVRPMSIGQLDTEDVSYYVVNVDAAKNAEIADVNLHVYLGETKKEVLEYSDNQTPEGWEKQKRLKFPIKLKKGEKVTVLFTSTDPAVNLGENKLISIQLENGQIIEHETGM